VQPSEYLWHMREAVAVETERTAANSAKTKTSLVSRPFFIDPPLL
jgi:hypothetical protein